MDSRPLIWKGSIAVGAVLLLLGLMWNHIGRSDRLGGSPLAEIPMDRPIDVPAASGMLPPPPPPLSER
jgi:hypothetical protein